MNRDEELISAIKESGFYEYKDVNLEDLTSVQRSAIILAGALLPFRPDLFNENEDPDTVFIIKRTLENGSVVCSYPEKKLSKLLNEPPFDDSVICSYSLKDSKILKNLYKGTGTKWEVSK